MCFHEVERLWQQDEASTREAFARSIQRVLQRRRKTWAETLDFDDLERWVAQRWPVPPQAMLTIVDWADAYYQTCRSRPKRRNRSATM